MAESPAKQWLCEHCGRSLDDHQLKRNGRWLKTPICVPPGTIAKGVRV